MDKTRITQLKSLFDDIVHYINNDNEQIEIWDADAYERFLANEPESFNEIMDNLYARKSEAESSDE